MNKKLSLFLAEAFISVPKATEGLGLLREELPQLGNEDTFTSFSAFCKSHGTRVSKKSVRARDLNPSQNEIDFDKVVDIVQDYTQLTPPVIQPIVIDKDGYIIDGHHRWAALMYMNPNMELPAYQFNVTIKHLLGNKVPRWQDTIHNDKKLVESKDTISESYNIASEFEKISKRIKGWSEDVIKEYVQGYKQFLKEVDSLENNKEKIALSKKFIQQTKDNFKAFAGSINDAIHDVEEISKHLY